MLCQKFSNNNNRISLSFHYPSLYNILYSSKWVHVPSQVQCIVIFLIFKRQVQNQETPTPWGWYQTLAFSCRKTSA